MRHSSGAEIRCVHAGAGVLTLDIIAIQLHEHPVGLVHHADALQHKQPSSIKKLHRPTSLICIALHGACHMH